MHADVSDQLRLNGTDNQTELVFEPGDTSRTITVFAIDDDEEEEDQTYTVTASHMLVNPFNTLSVDVPEDPADRPIEVSVTPSPLSVTEGSTAILTIAAPGLMTGETVTALSIMQDGLCDRDLTLTFSSADEQTSVSDCAPLTFNVISAETEVMVWLARNGMVEETDSTTIVITLSSDDVKFRLSELIIPVQIFNADPYEVNFSTTTITIQEGESASVDVSIINGQAVAAQQLAIDDGNIDGCGLTLLDCDGCG